MKPSEVVQFLTEQSARVAYEAYCENRDWKSYDGKPLPQWDDVRPDIKAGWIAAANAVVFQPWVQGLVDHLQASIHMIVGIKNGVTGDEAQALSKNWDYSIRALRKLIPQPDEEEEEDEKDGGEENPSAPSSLREHDLVRLLENEAYKDGVLPADSIGTIVSVYHDGRAFEVEFSGGAEPVILTLESSKVVGISKPE